MPHLWSVNPDLTYADPFELMCVIESAIQSGKGILWGVGLAFQKRHKEIRDCHEDPTSSQALL